MKIPVRRWLGTVRLSESVVFGAAAIVVGLSTGVGVWLFKQLISLTHQFMFGTLDQLLAPFGKASVVLLPVLGGVVVGLMSHFLIGKERYHGLPGIIEAVALGGGRLPISKMPVRVTAAAFSIGSGASVGPEDPSVQVGANLGSLVGQVLRLPEDRVRALVAGGAAAGIAAAFNAPIAGVFFALEVLMGELSASFFGFTAISAVISAVFTQAVAGSQPAFSIPPVAFKSATELPLYLILGLLAGPLAAAYIRLITLSHQVFHNISLPNWLKPGIAGLLVGGVGIFLPQIFGVGYETIGSILSNTAMPVSLLLILMLAKLILTPVSIGGGFVGGVFAPSLFLGATLGGAVGLISGQIFPNLGVSVPAFAMVGMAAVLAGTVHAPLTAIILLFEMTRDYRIILPLMFAVAISLTVSRHIQKDSVYRLPLTMNGIRLEQGRDVEVLEGITVGEVMNQELATLRENQPLSEALTFLTQTFRQGLPVLNAVGNLVGMLTLQDIEKAGSQEEGVENLRVGQVCTKPPLTVYPDETIGTALRRMSARDIGRLPVVSREDPGHLVGLLRRSDVIHAYDLALAKRTVLRQRTDEVRLGILSGANVAEVMVEAGSEAAGKRVSELHWSKDCLIASIRRGRSVLLPHGDTMLKSGDILVVVSEGEGLREAQHLCAKNGTREELNGSHSQSGPP